MKTLLLLFLFPFILSAQPLRVAVAANAQFVMDDLKAAFTKKTGIPLEIVISSSGKLTTQIQQGAPFDVFLSADMMYPKTLHEQGLTTAPPAIYGYGTLVLWTIGPLPLTADLRRTLLNPAIRHVAIANPDTAPYGEAALSVLRKKGLLEAVKPRLVYGESIAQVNQYVLSQSVEVGFTAKSVVLDPGLTNRGRWIELPVTDYAPIAQGVVIIKRTALPDQARQFVSFLNSPEARQILARFGYRMPNRSPTTKLRAGAALKNRLPTAFKS